MIAISNKMIIFAAEKTAKMLALGRMNKFLCFLLKRIFVALIQIKLCHKYQ